MDAFAPDNCVFCSHPKTLPSSALLIDLAPVIEPTRATDPITSSAERSKSISSQSQQSQDLHETSAAQRTQSNSSEIKKPGRQPLQRTLRAMSAASAVYHDNIYHYDPEFYDNWWKEHKEAVERGEDPYARFRAMVAARNEQSPATKLKRLFSKEKSYTRGAPVRLDPEEEAEARQRDAVTRGQMAGGTSAVVR
ncbi:hypothetical protein MMC19_003524 [Ptychographa xylographoides]|nr:hypothetical protein [Ptychographa xylographoides]